MLLRSLSCLLVVGFLFWASFFSSACHPPAGPSDAASTEKDAPPLTRLKTAQGSFEVEYTTQPSPIPLNELFSIEIKVASASDPKATVTPTKVGVDGFMPDHKHGMLRQPQIQMKDGKAIVEGMLFHMPGTWELRADITADGKTERATFTVILK